MKEKILGLEFGIFDLDGTLFDNKKFYRKMLLMILAFGFMPYSTNLYLPSGGLPVPQWAERISGFPGIRRLVASADRAILNFLSLIDGEEPKLFEGAREILLRLHEMEIKLFATTGSNEDNMRVFLRKMGMLDIFSLVTGSDKIPKKSHIPYFAERNGLLVPDFASKSFLVSDSPVDLILAAKYGAYGIGITNTLSPNLLRKVGAKEIILNLKELLE